MTLKSHTENVTTPVLIPAHGVDFVVTSMPEHAKGLIILLMAAGAAGLVREISSSHECAYDAGLAVF